MHRGGGPHTNGADGSTEDGIVDKDVERQRDELELLLQTHAEPATQSTPVQQHQQPLHGTHKAEPIGIVVADLVDEGRESTKETDPLGFVEVDVVPPQDSTSLSHQRSAKRTRIDPPGAAAAVALKHEPDSTQFVATVGSTEQTGRRASGSAGRQSAPGSSDEDAHTIRRRATNEQLRVANRINTRRSRERLNDRFELLIDAVSLASPFAQRRRFASLDKSSIQKSLILELARTRVLQLAADNARLTTELVLCSESYRAAWSASVANEHFASAQDNAELSQADAVAVQSVLLDASSSALVRVAELVAARHENVHYAELWMAPDDGVDSYLCAARAFSAFGGGGASGTADASREALLNSLEKSCTESDPDLAYQLREWVVLSARQYRTSGGGCSGAVSQQERGVLWSGSVREELLHDAPVRESALRTGGVTCAVAIPVGMPQALSNSTMFQPLLPASEHTTPAESGSKSSTLVFVLYGTDHAAAGSQLRERPPSERRTEQHLEVPTKWFDTARTTIALADVLLCALSQASTQHTPRAV